MGGVLRHGVAVPVLLLSLLLLLLLLLPWRPGGGEGHAPAPAAKVVDEELVRVAAVAPPTSSPAATPTSLLSPLPPLPRVPLSVSPITRAYLLHDATIARGQQTRANYADVVASIHARAPANVLIFGLGMDSAFYYRVRIHTQTHEHS
jgi:hypothetical protein